LGFCIRNIQGRIGSILTGSAFARAEAQIGSSIGNEPGEALVHVILVMAVEERRSGVVRDEIDLRSRVSRHADRVLDDAGGRLVADLRDLEGVTVQMNGVFVATAVV